MNRSSSAQPPLEQELALLLRKLNREKQARQDAEQLLEQYSRDIYETNQQLTKSLQKAEQGKQELEFLNQMSALVVADTSSTELVTQAAQLTASFIDAIYCVCINNTGDSNLELFAPKGQPTIPSDLMSYIREHLQPVLSQSTAHAALNWSAVNTPEHSVKGDWWQLTLAVVVDNNPAFHLVCLTNAFPKDDHSQVLKTAVRQLQTGINRRQNEVRVLQRNQALQESLDHLEAAKRQLIQAEKMASLGQLAAGIAHEINNPIGFITANLQILQDYVKEVNQCTSQVKSSASSNSINPNVIESLWDQSDIEFILADAKSLIASNLDGAKRVADIVAGLRTFSHSNASPVFEPLSIKDVINRALQLINNSLKYHYTVTDNTSDKLPQIKGNSGQLQQVFVNLFMNAIQAMPDGGTLTIDGIVDNNAVSVTVKDTGLGMDSKTLDQLFTPFFTTKPVGEGTGLGLSVSYAILQSHNASIDVVSEIGNGTCFTLHFPTEQAL